MKIDKCDIVTCMYKGWISENGHDMNNPDGVVRSDNVITLTRAGGPSCERGQQIVQNHGGKYGSSRQVRHLMLLMIIFWVQVDF